MRKKINSNYIRIVSKYCRDVKSGRIPSGIHLRNAVDRYQRDRKDKRFIFYTERFNKVVDFIGTLEHFLGKHSGKKFQLMPWQLFIVANLYGFWWRETKKRRFQNAYIEVARKQGKTALVAALSLYHLKEDNEPGGQILFTANSLDQSKIGFEMVNGFVRRLDPDEEIFKVRFKDIKIEDTDSFIKVLAADSSKLDGYNASVGIVDEYHSAPDSRVRDVIRSSQGMRENPMLLTITTAGFQKELPCYDLRTVATEIISGVKTDDAFFAVVYCLDDGDDWTDPKVWIKSNPNLGVTVNKEFLEREVLQAKNSPADEVGVRTKNLNQWCDSNSTWIGDDYILKAQKKLSREDFKDKPEPTFCGVDLASNTDLTAIAYLQVSGSVYNFLLEYYIPEDTIKGNVNHIDKELYKEWVYAKYLKVTSGNVTDYQYLTKDILSMNSLNEIERIYYDKYNANQWAIQCTEEGLNVIPFSQTLGNFNNPTKEFERLLLSGRIFMDDNPITRYCLRNVSLKMDFNSNVKPMKSSEKKKIDGVIAMIQALGAYMDYTANYHGTQIF